MSRRVVLHVPVEGGDHLSPGVVDAGLHGGGLTEVALQGEHAHVAAVLGLGLGHGPVAAVTAAVIHQDQFPGVGIIVQGAVHLLHHGQDIVLLVVHGDDHGQVMGHVRWLLPGHGLEGWLRIHRNRARILWTKDIYFTLVQAATKPHRVPSASPAATWLG